MHTLINKFLIWLLLTLLSAVLLIWGGLSAQHTRRTAEFEQLAAGLLKSLAQHDALMPLLNGGGSFNMMKKKFPQIVMIEPLPASVSAGESLTSTGEQNYWLNNHFRRIRLLIDARILGDALFPREHFVRVAVHWHHQLLYQSRASDQTGWWQWQRTLNSTSQPLTLTATGNPELATLSWGVIGALAIIWGLIVEIGGQLIQQRHRRKVADLRARFFELTRVETMNEMATGMLHELNQPLTAVMSYSQAALRLLEHQYYDQIPSVLQANVVQVQRMATLLQAWRNNLDHQFVEWQQVDLCRVWLRVEMLLERELHSCGVQILRDFDSNLPMINSVELWLEQIFHNLLSNAIQIQQHQQGNRWVKVEATCAGDQVCIQISDGGPGFSPEVLEQLFMPFFTTRPNGIGLGMTLTETLIQRLRGSIVAENSPQGGASLTLLLPQGRDHVDRLSD